jgi:hypothetical protein
MLDATYRVECGPIRKRVIFPNSRMLPKLIQMLEENLFGMRVPCRRDALSNVCSVGV